MNLVLTVYYIMYSKPEYKHYKAQVCRVSHSFEAYHKDISLIRRYKAWYFDSA